MQRYVPFSNLNLALLVFTRLLISTRSFAFGLTLLFGVFVAHAPAMAANTPLCVCTNAAQTTCRSFSPGDAGAPQVFPDAPSCLSFCQRNLGDDEATFGFLANPEPAQRASSIEDCKNISKATELNNQASNATSSVSSTASFARQFVVPVLNVPIPGLSFTAPFKKGSNIVSNFFAIYVDALYKFLLGTSIAVAIVMLMIGGFQYTLGATSQGQIEAAKTRINNALIGLVLLMGSAILLYLVNPQLTLLSSVGLLNVEPNPIDFAEFDKGEVGGVGTSASALGSTTPDTAHNLSDPVYDDIFKAFGNCVNLDWRVLKGVAFLESGLNASITNKFGFTGLFQTKKTNCETGYLRNDPEWKTRCFDLTNPSVNTAVGARSLDSALKIVEKSCPKTISNGLKGAMVYFAHNSGNGALQYVLKHGGCQGDNEFLAGIASWWKNKGKDDAFVSTRQASARRASSFIASLGTGDFRDASQNGSASCPLDGPPPTSAVAGTGGASCNTSGSSILSVGDSITANAQSYAVQLGASCTQVAVTRLAVSGKQTSWMDEQVTQTTLNGKEYLIILGGVNDISSGTFANTKAHLTSIYQKAKQAGVKVVAITQSPWKGWSSWTTEKHQQTLELNAWIRSQQGVNVDYVVDFYELTKDPQDPEKLAPAYDSRDHLHPTAAAHTVLMNAIIQTIYQ